MACKEMRNKEYESPKTTNRGICRYTGNKAEVTSYFRGTIECRTDLQNSNHFLGYKCSLQKETNYMNPACMDECRLIQKELL